MMMVSKKIVPSLFFILFAAANMFADNIRIVIEITGVNVNAGNIHVGILTNEQDHKKKAFYFFMFIIVEQQKYYLPGGGLILLKGDHSPTWEEEPDNLMVGAIYKSAIINEIPLGYPSVFHYIDLIAERKIKSHFIQGLITSYSDKPFYGGLHTTYSQIGYGYELIRKENINLTLGLALGISD
jgi:hypothetical protein